MNNFDKKNSIAKNYQIAGLIAFIYSLLLFIFSIYKQFIYVDGTWFHGFTANGFSVLSNLIWIGILFVFKQYLNKILNYSKVNLLINIYLIFLSISTISVFSVLYKSIQVYLSTENTENLNTLTGFASTSISSAIFLFISNFVIILVCILLGNRIRKIDIIESKLFQILGFTFIAYGLFSLLTSITIIESEIFQFLAKVVLAILIGLILKKVYNIDFSKLDYLKNSEKSKDSEKIKQKTQNSVEQKTENKNSEQVYTKRDDIFKDEGKKVNFQKEELPNINLDEIEDKELVISYYENLPQEELNRLENIVVKKYNQNLTKEQKRKLVIQYIVENKTYDHQRFLPK